MQNEDIIKKASNLKKLALENKDKHLKKKAQDWREEDFETERNKLLDEAISVSNKLIDLLLENPDRELSKIQRTQLNDRLDVLRNEIMKKWA